MGAWVRMLIHCALHCNAYVDPSALHCVVCNCTPYVLLNLKRLPAVEPQLRSSKLQLLLNFSSVQRGPRCNGFAIFFEKFFVFVVRMKRVRQILKYELHRNENSTVSKTNIFGSVKFLLIFGGQDCARSGGSSDFFEFFWLVSKKFELGGPEWSDLKLT